ncbi:ornithine cyclodeaminase family protein [Thermovenabulum gondwanense]|uniref:Delta(1)-pyrroline-2-carboxylate reductase n=1 Tax=Thermovenabulum gondwanense TaxID=520767 RepID=A0A162MTN8_9FIRM|nr:ornithine cyclodeaminase family protein [Thermovenabulum gondwanense]KYO67309.1 Delta(1)-pyrroline-2-carboxylate reductase [Thermovenabulum gondwanense]
MLIISAEEMKKVLSMKEAIEAVKKAYITLARGNSIVPLRTNITVKKHNGQILFMPSYVEGVDFAGVKVVSVYPENVKKGLPAVPATMILVDGSTGIVNAIMDGTYLTRLRTGAASGAATEILARKDAKKALLFGTGGQAETQLWALLCVRKLEEVYVFDIDFNRAKQFAEKMNETFKDYNAKITAVENADDVLPEVDIITTATTSKKPVFNGNLIKKGVHINGIGAYTPEMQEIPEEAVLKADKIYVDSLEACMAEAGDLIIPINKGVINKEKITGEIGKLLTGELSGRTSENEITMFKSVGLAVQDVVTAAKIYEKALELGLGKDITL